ARLERLVAIGVTREDDDVALPRRPQQLLAERLGRVLLHHDLAVEVAPRAEAPVLVRGARVAVRARVEAASIRVEAEAKGDVGAVVLGEDGARLLLVNGEGRV